MDSEQLQFITTLIAEIEQKMGFALKSPQDFNQLLLRLPQDCRVSLSTVKRIWGYVPSTHQPRLSSLSALSRFVGFRDWEDFCLKQKPIFESDFLQGTIKETDVLEGEVVELTWNPNRYCKVRKEADGTFVVEEVRNAKLQRGDSFRAAWFAVGQPLCLTHFQRAGLSMPDYIAGRSLGLSSVHKL